jgi:hypothetical protein
VVAIFTNKDKKQGTVILVYYLLKGESDNCVEKSRLPILLAE